MYNLNIVIGAPYSLLYLLSLMLWLSHLDEAFKPSFAGKTFLGSICHSIKIPIPQFYWTSNL